MSSCNNMAAIITLNWEIIENQFVTSNLVISSWFCYLLFLVLHQIVLLRAGIIDLWLLNEKVNVARITTCPYNYKYNLFLVARYLMKKIYSQTCIKSSPLEQRQSGLLRQVTSWKRLN